MSRCIVGLRIKTREEIEQESNKDSDELDADKHADKSMLTFEKREVGYKKDGTSIINI
jgi:hypothetical protein